MKLRITDAAVEAGHSAQQCATSPVVRAILEAALPYIKIEYSEPNGEQGAREEALNKIMAAYKEWDGSRHTAFLFADEVAGIISTLP
ncbi:hypothetical protein [Ensifer sp. LCM 4579]|uniref:hypothetical protein n=1 Tax=Ensifer sp. LCM 4579 TaxID=1848292 RepID=UPI0008D9C99C|nr:hypothetical protein [Ensifer sp. LCM 4579]OHV73357.1 hypothetical protein LCM4579_10575 [Ensifer sp. LCM 4579]